MVREMVGGCCVCLDDRGWDENPLVYCDGHGCNVAVHQACYGIVKVPSGPWFCCKCQSTERVARVDQRMNIRQKSKLKASFSSDKKCELCPLKEGALKKTDTQGWAHVVCALYIPEVRFGNVSTMEPIILASVPHDRYLKTCYICEENGRESKTSCGACMACNKPGCKLSFHVTCAQAKRLLCEESGHGNGNVQYVGYCAGHWAKKPTGKTGLDVESKKLSKKTRVRTESMSSTEGSLQNKRGRKGATTKLMSCTPPPAGEHTVTNGATPVGKSDSQFNSNSFNLTTSSPISSSNGKSSTSQSRTPYPVSQVQFSINDLINTQVKEKQAGPHLEETVKEHKTKKEEQSKNEAVKNTERTSAQVQKNKRKLIEKVSDKIVKRQKLLKKGKERKILKTKKGLLVSKKETQKSQKLDRKVMPKSDKLDVYENGKLRPLCTENTKLKCPSSFQELLEFQWNQSAQFIIQKASHFDVASLLSTLHQLRADNVKLETRLGELTARRDRLLAANARLSVPLSLEKTLTTSSSLANMLPKLRSDTNEEGSTSHFAEAPCTNGETSNDLHSFNGYQRKKAGSASSSTADESPNSKKGDSKSQSPDPKDPKLASFGKLGKTGKGAAGRKKEKKKTKEEKEEFPQHCHINGANQQSLRVAGSIVQPGFSCTQEPSGLFQPGPPLIGGPSSFIHQMLHQQRHSASAGVPGHDSNMLGLLGSHPYSYSTASHESPHTSSLCYSAAEASKGSIHKK